jgi:hypothetical protein
VLSIENPEVMKCDVPWGEFRDFDISALRVSGSRGGNDLWNREFQTPVREKTKDPESSDHVEDLNHRSCWR